MKTIRFQNDAPMFKYFQKHGCFFSSLASAFSSITQNKAANDISFGIEESLKSKMGNRIDFANAILKNEKKLKGEPRVYYSLSKYKNMGSYDFLTDIGEHVTLF